MKLLDILNEERPVYKNEFKVEYTVLKDKDFSKGTASYENEADARKFFNDLQKDDEVASATLRKFVGPDSSKDMMGGFAKHEGSSYDLERYTHPAYSKKGELEGQEKNIRMYLSTPSFILKKRGFTNKDGSDRWFKNMEENLKEENISHEDIMQDIINNPNRRVYDLVDWFNHSVPMFEKDWDAFMYGRYAKFLNNKDTETKIKMHKVLQRMTNKMNEDISLEGLYNQIQESRYGFFSNSEGQTASDIMTEALNEYEAAVEKAFQTLINKTNTAINIEKSGGTDTEVRENLAYQFDKIQEKITTGDYLNATFYK